MITTFGTDIASATKHYITSGYSEGRSVTFDAASYLGANADLGAYNSDEELANNTINFGYWEALLKSFLNGDQQWVILHTC